MKGRKPKTPEQREKDGSKSRPSHEKNPPAYEPGKPDCPEHLDKEAKSEWTRLCDRLFAAGTLTHEARSTMTGYCIAWSLSVDAYKHLQKYGAVIVAPKTQWPTQSPYLNIMLSALKQMNSFAAELGITPSSRGRVQAVKVEKEDPKKRFFKVVG